MSFYPKSGSGKARNDVTSSPDHIQHLEKWMEDRGGVRWRDKARGKDVCGGGHPLGTDYLPPDCWTGTDNKKILIVNSQGAVTRGGKGEGGTLFSCYVAERKSKRGLDRDNKTPGISPYRTLAEKLISVYLFRHHFRRTLLFLAKSSRLPKRRPRGSWGVQIAN